MVLTRQLTFEKLEDYKVIEIYLDGEISRAYQFNGKLYDKHDYGGRCEMVAHKPQTGRYCTTDQMESLPHPFGWQYGPDNLHIQTVGTYKGMEVEVKYAGGGKSDVLVKYGKASTVVGQVETCFHNPDHASNTDLVEAERLVMVAYP